MTPPVILVPVEDERAERRLLDATPPGSNVVPVVDKYSALARLQALLTRHGVNHRVGRDREEVRATWRGDAHARRQSGGVIEVGDIPSDISALARHLFVHRGDSHGTSCPLLVLLDTTALDVGEARRRLLELRERGNAIGVMPVSDSPTARFALLKSLLVDRVVVSPSRTVFLARGAGANAPPAVTSDGPSIPLREADLIGFAGHSNPFDMSLGDWVLCGRRSGERGGRRRFPCYADDYCHPLSTERERGDRSRLIDPSDLSAALVFLYGCNLLVPGRGFNDATTGILHAVLESDCLASVASIGLRRPPFELWIFWLVLLARGRSLGEAWREIDAFEQEHFGRGDVAASLASVVVGNPALEIAGLTVREIADGGDLVVDVDSHFGALIALVGQRHAGYRVSVRGTDGWTRGIRSDRQLLLWVHCPGEGTVTVDVQALDPGRRAGILKAFERFVGELLFWDGYMRSWRELLGDHDPHRPSAEWPEHLASVRYRGAQLLARYGGSSDVLVAPPLDDEAVLSLVQDELRLSSRTLLEQVMTLSIRNGLLHFHVWSETYVHVATRAGVERCVCGGGDRDAWIWAARGSGPDRCVYECLQCGPVGEDGGDGRFRMISRPPTVDIGSAVVLECEVAAPPGEVVHVIGQALVEFWRRDRSPWSEVFDVTVPAGERQRLRVEVPLPPDATRGIHVLGVIAIVNGTLVIARQVVELV